MPLFQRKPRMSEADIAERDRRQRIADESKQNFGWWHSIDFGYGVVTKGYKTPEHLKDELEAMQFPDVRGKSVLDIGAWDGFYSYEAERRGASRVVALDHFVWCLDTWKQMAYVERCREQGIKPQAYETVPEIWRPQELPGKRSFDTAHDVLQSKVEAVVADFMEVDLDSLGTFDVVLFLGVLYHMKNPVAALERVRALCKGIAVIETEAMEIAGCEDKEMWESYSSDQLLGDNTNWWAPNQTALIGMCQAAGFSSARVTRGLAKVDPKVRAPQHYRLFVQAQV